MKKKIICAVFLAALIIPTISWLLFGRFISAENREKREYAAFPEVSASNYKNIPAEFEEWFNDRLPYKNQLTSLNAEIKRRTGLENNWMDYVGGLGIIFGKEGWLFYNGNNQAESTINDYICNNLYPKQELERLAEGYQKLSDQYKAHGTDFILFIPPNKEQVYPEFMPDELVPAGEVSRTDQLVKYLKENTTVRVVYAKEYLRAQKNPDYTLYFKYDSHWNNVGAFAGAQLIREELTGERTDLSEVEVFYNETVIAPRDLADLYGLGAEYSEGCSWDVSDPGLSVEGGFTTENPAAEAEFMQYESAAEDQRELVIIKDSFVFNMITALKQYFGKLTMISDSKTAKEYVENNHPSVVILEIVERQYYRAEHQWEELLE